MIKHVSPGQLPIKTSAHQGNNENCNGVYDCHVPSNMIEQHHMRPNTTPTKELEAMMVNRGPENENLTSSLTELLVRSQSVNPKQRLNPQWLPACGACL